MKYFSVIFLLIISVNSITRIYSQSYNNDKTSLSNFVKRMYNNSPFEGVKVLESAEGNFFISVIALEKAKYSSQSTMMRVAQVKAQSQANTFFNGSSISSDFIIKTTEEKQTTNTSTKTTIETVEEIRENSIGFVKALELLTNFEIEDGKRIICIYFKELKSDE
jgi:predicted house-cleaning NTP pyrophosphatase (Maf/HAM1 superfamily)